jgi:hypothetical protein
MIRPKPEDVPVINQVLDMSYSFSFWSQESDPGGDESYHGSGLLSPKKPPVGPSYGRSAKRTATAAPSGMV